MLVLLAVGSVDPDLIARHRRTKTFTREDYRRLHKLIDKLSSVRVTPNALTEASNLLAQHREPERTKLLIGLKQIIESSEEVVVASADAARGHEFKRLGLTDAALLEIVSESAPLVTVDAKLYYAALKKQVGAAYNFWHWSPENLV